ncbi:DeoR/GlpR family DNA-binding transcription regulator [Herbaspirillum sp. NPDC087042]|uniref:DeoR/GlpR family DNA-binding transcription regulator n=1 Tax=Herbaspirillum sp. NPDC087042 TaxID=3364004 RepID=UPI00381009F1
MSSNPPSASATSTPPTLGARARAQRLARMHEMIREQGPTPLARIAEVLGVTVMTVRRDLAGEDSPLICLGGHVLEASPSESRYSIDREVDQHAQRKRLACQHAARRVEEGDSVFIDCGTTMTHLAEALPAHIALSVICYSLNIANIVSQRPNTQVILLGGLYHPSSASFASEEGVAYLRRLGVNKAFLSAGGVDPKRGVSCSNFHEVAIKQAAIDSAAQCYVVIDQSKLGRFRPAFYSTLDVFSGIVVGGTPEQALLDQFSDFPLEVVAG